MTVANRRVGSAQQHGRDQPPVPTMSLEALENYVVFLLCPDACMFREPAAGHGWLLGCSGPQPLR